MNDIARKTPVRVFEIEYLLKSQDNNTQTLIEDTDKRIYERLTTDSCSFNYEHSILCDTTKERHVLFERVVPESKASIELSIKEFSKLFSKEVQKFDNFSVLIN